MRMGGVDLSDIRYVPEDVAPSIAQYRIESGDIFISCAGTLGIVGMVPDELHGANLTENANRISSIRINPELLLHLLCSDLIQEHITNTRTLGAQPKLALGRIRSFAIPCPDDHAEQKAIAEALSDADGVVAGLERLIEKKRWIKQGAMQDLLTAKRRLTGFSEEWVERKLGEVLTVRHGRSQKDVESPNGAYPILATGGQIGFANAFLWDKPSVMIGRKGTIDRPQFMDTPFWTVDTLFYTDIKSPNDARYLFGVFKLIDWTSYNEASGVPSLNASTIEAIKVLMPDQNEQVAIAEILEDMDAEITALEVRLQKARAIKEGMMQNLLTGRIRLV